MVVFRGKSLQIGREKRGKEREGRMDRVYPDQMVMFKIKSVCDSAVSTESQTSAVLNAALAAMLMIYPAVWEQVPECIRNPFQELVAVLFKDFTGSCIRVSWCEIAF